MRLRQTWDQLYFMPLEDDLYDIVWYVLKDERKLFYLKEFIEKYKNEIPKDAMEDTAKLIINMSQHNKDVINPDVLHALFEIPGFTIDIKSIKHYEYIVRKGHPKIISNPNLSRYMDIQELYDYFKIMNTDALITLVKTFEASLYDRFINDVHKMQLSKSVYEYLKMKNDFKTIDYKSLLVKLERSLQTMSSDMFYFGDEMPADEPIEDLTWYSYADRSREDYIIRLKIFRQLNIEWTTEFIQYLKEHQLFDFLYIRALSDLRKISQ
jgi:hypothetical protein